MDNPAPQDEIHKLSALSQWLGTADSAVAARVVAATSDVALILDREGVIRDLSVGTAELARSGLADLIGQTWADTVTKESRGKVSQILADAGAGHPARERHINQNTITGGDVPISFSAIGLGEKGQIIALGRDMRTIAVLQRRLVEAQQAMEREYARLRSAETRYRMLFHVSSEPVVIVDSRTLKIVEANPAAQRALGHGKESLVNQSMIDILEAVSGQALKAAITAAQTTGHAPDMQVHTARQGHGFRMAISTFRQDSATLLLLRFAALDRERPDIAQSPLRAMIEQMPDGFVATDADLTIIDANQAFLDLAQLSARTQAVGTALERWLGRTGIDLPLLIENLNTHGSARNFSTIVRGEFGSVEDIELSAVRIVGSGPVSYGLSMRAIGVRRPGTSAVEPHLLPRSVEHMMQLVSRVPLKELVREATDLIERLSIEAALQLTKDNRASAANLLGLSRQSLYAKMRRHGLGDLDGPEDTDQFN